MTDDHETQFRLEWDARAVPIEALDRALYALADRVTGVVEVDGARLAMRYYARGTTVDRIALEHAIRAEVNDQTLRLRIAERSDPIRNLVFALAFSKSGLVEGASAS